MIIFENKIKSIEDIENDTSLKTLGQIPLEIRTPKFSELIIHNSEKSEIYKAFVNLVVNMQFLNVNKKDKRTILVTSTNKFEGKSYVAANMAISFAKIGKKVIIIDADLSSGKQEKLFTIPSNLGLSNYLSSIDSNGIEIKDFLNKYINETEIKNLNLITSGTVPPNPTELLQSEKLKKLIKDLKEFYDVIIIDGTSVMEKINCLELVKLVNSIIYVVTYGKTSKENFKTSITEINNLGGKITGVVLNKIKDKVNNNKKHDDGKENTIDNINKKNNNLLTKLKQKIKIKINKLINNLKEKNKKNSIKLLNEAQFDNIKQDINVEKSNIPKDINNKKTNIKKDINNKKTNIKKDINNEKSNIKKDIDNKKLNIQKDINNEKLNIQKDINNDKSNIPEDINNKKSDIKTENDDKNCLNSNKNNYDTAKIEIEKNKIKSNSENIEKTDIEKVLKRVKLDENTVLENVKINVTEDEIEIEYYEEDLDNKKDNKNIIKNIFDLIKKKYILIKEKLILPKNKNDKEHVAENYVSEETTNEKVLMENEKDNKEINNLGVNTNLDNNLENVPPIDNKFKNVKLVSNEAENIIIGKNELTKEQQLYDEYNVNGSSLNNIQDKNNLYEMSNEIVDNTVLVIIDAENAFCRVFSKHCFVEQEIKNKVDKIDYSSKSIKKINDYLNNMYNLTKKQIERIDPVIYSTLNTFDERVKSEMRMESNKSESYIMCMSQEFDKLPNEKDEEYVARCHRLRKKELAKMELEIEYNLDNIWSTKKMKIFDKISMYKFAKLYEVSSKLKNDYEIQESNKNKAFYKDIENATANNLTFEKNEAKHTQKRMRRRESRLEKYNEKKFEKEYRRSELKKQKEEKRKVKEEEKRKRETQKQNKRKKMKLEEELLEDNLYPKTKNYKDLF